MSECPWCGAEGLSRRELQTLGPLMPKKCHQCGHYVRASWPSTLVSISLVLAPFLGAMVYAHAAGLADLPNLLVSAVGLAVGGGLALAWYPRHVHLLRVDRGGPQPG